MRGTFWLALKTPVQAVIGLWSISLTQRYIGKDANGDYVFAWGFGFLQFVLEFGMSSALQRQMVAAYARGDRDGVNRTIACGMNFYAAVALIQMAILIGIAHGGLLPVGFRNPLVLGLLWVQILTTPFFGISTVVGGVLQAARRYEFIPRLEMAIVLCRFGLLWAGFMTGAPFLAVVALQVAVQIGLSLGPAALGDVARNWGTIPKLGGVSLPGPTTPIPHPHQLLHVFLIQLERRAGRQGRHRRSSALRSTRNTTKSLMPDRSTRT